MDPEDPDSNPDHCQNFFFFLLPLQTYPENFIKSVHKFLSYLVHKRTNKLTNKQTNPGEKITSLAEMMMYNSTRKDYC